MGEEGEAETPPLLRGTLEDKRSWVVAADRHLVAAIGLPIPPPPRKGAACLGEGGTHN